MNFRVLKNFTVIAAIGLTGVNASADVSSEFVCPLEPPEAAKNLVNDVTDLYNKLKPLMVQQAECQSKGSLSNSATTAASLATSAKELVVMYSDKENQLNDPEKLMAFQGHLIAVSKGIEDIGQNIASSNVFQDGSNCSPQGITAPNIIQSIGKITTTLAPMALKAISLNPAFGAGLNLIIGGIGLNSISTIFDQWKNNPNFDMSNPENRKFVMEQTCAYYKLDQRFKILQAAMSRPAQSIQDIIQLQNKRLNAQINALSSRPAQQLILYRDTEIRKINELLADQKTIDRRMNAILASLPKDPSAVCNEKARILDLGTQAAQNIRKLYGSTELLEADIEGNEILKSVESQTQTLKSLGSAPAAQRICMSQIFQYSKTVNKLNSLAPTVVNSRSEVINSKVNNSKSYQAYKAEKAKGELEIKKLKNLNEILLASQDVQSIPISEITLQMGNLRRALIEPPRLELSNFFNWELQKKFVQKATNLDFSARRSIITAWLEYIDQAQQGSMREFNSYMKALRAYSLDNTSTQGVTNYGDQIMTPYQIQQALQSVDDKKTSQVLGNFKLKTAKSAGIVKGTEVYNRVCEKLAGAMEKWTGALTHLNAEIFFCKAIEPLYARVSESQIEDHCKGTLDLNNRVVTPSTIATRIKETSGSKAFADSQLIIRRMRDLACPAPPLLNPK